LQDAVRRLPVIDRRSPGLVIVLFCKSGRDRSVGLSVVLERKLRHAGWNTEIRHLCLAAWRENRRCEQEARRMSRRPGSFAEAQSCPVCWVGNSTDVVRRATAAWVVPGGAL